jgi:hypothetical protein
MLGTPGETCPAACLSTASRRADQGLALKEVMTARPSSRAVQFL